MARDNSSTASRKSTRVDAPHTLPHKGPTGQVAAVVHEAALSDAAPPSRAALEQIAGFHDLDNVSDQLRRQADELSDALRLEQADMDRREATFNAHLARMENELRLTRLLQQERESQLEQREADSAERLRQLEAASDPAATGPPGEPRAEGTRHTRVAEQQAIAARDRWRERWAQLDASECSLKTQLADMGAERQRLERQRQQWDQERQRQQQELTSLRHRDQVKLQRQQLALQQKAESLDRKREAIAQLHAEITRMHREAVEMRLCTEELWGRLTQEVSPAELTQRLGALRSKLADQFHLAQQGLAQQRKELGELMGRLAKSQRKVSRQRANVQQWVARRQAEIEEQAARLIAREHQLDTKQFENHRLRERLHQQRNEYEQEIRRLLRRVHDDSAAA